MSQQSVHLDSFMHTSHRFGSTGSHAVDVLGTQKHATLVAPSYPIKREISSDGTAAFGGEVTFKFPSAGYVHRVEIRTVLADTATADYSDYPGAVIVDTVELRADNETLHQYPYAAVFQYYLSKLKSEEARDKVLLSVGGVNVGQTGPTTVMTPIPTFFDSVMIKGARPLNLSKFKKAPELKLTMRSLANSAKNGSTGGAITSMTIVVWMSESSSTLKNMHMANDNDFHKSIDFYVNDLNTVVTSTATNIDISGCKGNIKKLFIYSRTVADVTGNDKQYFSNNEIDIIKTSLDGHEEFVFKTKEEGESDYITYNNGHGYNSTLGYPYIVPYGFFATDQYATSHTGGIHSAKVHKHEIIITHSVGGDEYVDILGIRSAIFKYDNGNMIRLL